jgi:hypothetical protein
MTAEQLWQRLRHAPAALCANPTCARTVRFKGELCDRCSRCWLCERGLFPGHEHIPNPTRRREDGAA